jgi:heme o synthase
MPVLLFAIIFFWTPPHFWALALFVQSDYAKVGIPMMPVVAGEKATRRQIWWYTLALTPIAVAPWAIGGTSWIYGMTAVTLSALFIILAWPVGARMKAEADAMLPEKKLFKFSIYYLFALFAALVADRVAAYQGWIA